ncbi:UNVERIFIED_CONTAM: hypothetical protein GTU68_023153 [Idotea baltica]|nr:hypothetical protein [Idotea baltica]
MTTALANGAKEFLTCQSVDEARELAQTHDADVLLCGERHCKPIDGFHLGNSPAEYSSDVVQDRSLILTTTNGTFAIAAAQNARAMVAASFLNLSAVVVKLRDAGSVHLVCAGTNGEITAEDVLLAGAIVDRLSSEVNLELVGDDAILARELWTAWMGEGWSDQNERLTQRLAESQGGRNLIGVGYEADLGRCAAIDLFDVVPERIATTPNTFGIL